MTVSTLLTDYNTITHA